MRHLFLTLLLVFAVVASSPAFARDPNATVFPPAGCSRSEQRVITWQDGTTTTMCATGQQVMNLAIPVCGEGQFVVREGGQFICKTVASPPACGANEFLTFDGRSYTCGATNVPTCAANQVLTFNGSGFICVNRTDEIPTCAPNQFLTYNGAFQCASTQQVNIPACAADQFVKADGASFYCDSMPVASSAAACVTEVWQVGRCSKISPCHSFYEIEIFPSLPCGGTSQLHTYPVGIGPPGYCPYDPRNGYSVVGRGQYAGTRDHPNGEIIPCGYYNGPLDEYCTADNYLQCVNGTWVSHSLVNPGWR